MTDQEQAMKKVYDSARSNGASIAMSALLARDYGYHQGWIVESSFITLLRSS